MKNILESYLFLLTEDPEKQRKVSDKKENSWEEYKRKMQERKEEKNEEKYLEINEENLTIRGMN